jgi:uncharacterized YigZ family protein
MKQEYLTIKTPGAGEVDEKKSRFIAQACHAESAEEAAAHLAATRKENFNARHNCYAYIIGGVAANERFSDDGEPSGTAGKPILEVLRGAAITNSMIIVTRYFGGTLLGTGGLVRAYTAAAKAALERAVIVRMCLCDVLTITVEYSQLDRILYWLQSEKITHCEPVYTDKVSVEITVPQGESALRTGELTEMTTGQAIINKKLSRFTSISG